VEIRSHKDVVVVSGPDEGWRGIALGEGRFSARRDDLSQLSQGGAQRLLRDVESLIKQLSRMAA
jgi:hypothetical protein